MVGYYSDRKFKDNLYPDSYKESYKVLKKMNNPDMEFFLLSDESPRAPFIEYLESKNLEYSKDNLRDIINETYPVIIQIKNYYNRPRPEQVNSEIEAYDSNTAKTPAYPSVILTEKSAILGIIQRPFLWLRYLLVIVRLLQPSQLQLLLLNQ